MKDRTVITIDQSDSLFRRETPKDWARNPWLSWLTAGCLFAQEITMEPDRFYLVDVFEDNEYFVYDRESVKSGKKYLYKIKDYKLEYIESIPQAFNVTVQIMGVPCFDPAFGKNAGTWVKLDYSVRILLSVSREMLGRVREEVKKDPLRTIQNKLSDAARSTLAHLSYDKALTGQTEEKLVDWVRGYKEVIETGLTVERVDIEEIEGSKKVDEAFQGQFNRLLEANDKSDIAMMFKQLDDEAINAYLTLGGLPDAGNIMMARNRMTQQMLTALLADGKSVMQAYQQTLQGIDRTKSNIAVEPENKPLQNSTAEHLFDQIKDVDWTQLEIPNTKKHTERLKWERDVFMERVPQWLTDDADEKLFVLKVGKGNDMLQIRWDDKDAPPQVWLNGRPRQDDYAILSPSAWDPAKRTLWDVYLATWRLVNAVQ
ncbi:MAG TPA: hypothetical protein DIW27_12370 [Cytophagales bacterium]|nr:hypothetical protein [Cytophagales bacterium]HRJ55145.1 hypothetical protein [Anaerolineales bacterium]